jgi:excisionase family DNA binding protein
MRYERHHLAIQTYTVIEHNSVPLPDHCTWKVLKHQGDGKFDNQPDAEGELCLILEDAESGVWPVMSFLLREEALQLSKQLRQAAEGFPNGTVVLNDSPNRYEKHHLAIGKYTVIEPGQVSLPDHCTWTVLKHQGGGKFNGRPDAKGAMCLILGDAVNAFWPIMSFLLREEGLQLSEQLHNAAEGSLNHPVGTRETVLTTQQAAEILKVSPRQVTRLIKKNLLEVIRFGKVYILTQEEVERYQRERKPRGRPASPHLTDTKALNCDDHAGNQYRLPFSIIRKIRPGEYEKLETAMDKLVDAVHEMNLEKIDYACRNYLAKKAELLEALREAFEDILPLIDSTPPSPK